MRRRRWRSRLVEGECIQYAFGESKNEMGLILLPCLMCVQERSYQNKYKYERERERDREREHVMCVGVR